MILELRELELQEILKKNNNYVMKKKKEIKEAEGEIIPSESRKKVHLHSKTALWRQ